MCKLPVGDDIFVFFSFNIQNKKRLLDLEENWNKASWRDDDSVGS